MTRVWKKRIKLLKDCRFFRLPRGGRRAGERWTPAGVFRPTGQILDRESRDRRVFHIRQRLEKRNVFNCSLQLQNFYNEVLDTRRPRLI